MMHHSIDFISTLHQDVATPADSLESMLELERTTYSCHDYLNESFCGNDDNADGISTTATIPNRELCDKNITPTDRMRIVDWCYCAVDQCQFDRDTVAIAMNIVDRFMSITTNPTASQQQSHQRSSSSTEEQEKGDVLQDRTHYQLVAATSLFISIKLNEQETFSSIDLAAASDGAYTVQAIEDMEIEIFGGLSWRLCPPTSLQVGYRILSLLQMPQFENTNTMLIERGTWEFLRNVLAYQTESSVRDYYFTTQRPSTTAIAGIINAIEQVKNHRDYTCLTTALLRVLKEFAFDASSVLLVARCRLNRLMDEHDKDCFRHDI
mmetsp:Transcript_23712/g.42919  ORF Transcript_23712/g.42919 Transcript_23712/m.42919 type:complete len:322 (+) Transcript_23712:54-1019(+)